MPPSGYSSKQSQLIVGFLSSCAEALAAEARAKGLSLDQALEKECADIEGALAAGWADPRSRPVLEMTGTFYRELAGHTRGDAARFMESVREVLKQFDASISAVSL